MQSAPGLDGITYYHLNHLPSCQHVLATLFNKLLEARAAPSFWGSARIKLVHKAGNTDDPSNFRPIALTSVVGKLFHKILSRRLEEYLKVNSVIDACVQKGFLTGVPGVFEHVYSLSAILQDALAKKKPLMMIFLDLRNAFGSVSHQLIFDMLTAVRVPSSYLQYIQSFYSHLSVTIMSKSWETDPIPFRRGVFQGDTLSPIVFLLVFNPILQLAESLNQSYGYKFLLPVEGTDTFPPVQTFIYVKWTESGDELPGWYKAQVEQYYLDGSCKIVYCNDNDCEVSEVVNFNSVDWKPCSKRARKFVPLSGNPSTTKANWKPCPKLVDSTEHSVKGYADDVTVISTNLDTHVYVLQTVDQKASDLDLSFKPVKCVSYLYDGAKHLKEGILLSKGTTRSITEGGTKFLGKLIDVSLSATKKAANKQMIARFGELLTTTDVLSIRGEYKVWIYRNYILSLLRFHLSIDAVTQAAIARLESMATRYLKKWLHLPRSATRVILYYPGVCCPSISCVSKEAKLNLLSCVSASSDPQLHELGLHLQLGNTFLQVHDHDYSILSAAKKQLNCFPLARSLYLEAKHHLVKETRSQCENHLQTLTVQSKFGDSAKLEATCGSWNRLMSGFHPGQLSFLLRASSDTLPTAVNLCRWKVQCSARCTLCASTRPTTAHVLSGCPAALTQNRYTYRHNLALQCLAFQLINVLKDFPSIQVFADIPTLQASLSPLATIPPAVLVTSYRPDLVFYNAITNSIALLEFTCPLDSEHHLEAARSRKQGKVEYQQLLAEFDRLHISNYYETLEISVLGHYHLSSIQNLRNLLHFVHQDVLVSKTAVRKLLDLVAQKCITGSQRIFLARDSSEWHLSNPD